MQYVLGVVNTTVTPALTSSQANYYRVNSLLAIDRNTNRVYAIESPITPNPSITATGVFTGFLSTVTSVTQCYQVVGIDANSVVSDPTTFCVSPKLGTCYTSFIFKFSGNLSTNGSNLQLLSETVYDIGHSSVIIRFKSSIDNNNHIWINYCNMCCNLSSWRLIEYHRNCNIIDL
jgi:hypothetical protein